MELMEFQLRALAKDIAYLGGGAEVAKIMGVTPHQVYLWQIIPTAITWSEYCMVELLTYIKERENPSLTDVEVDVAVECWIDRVRDEARKRAEQ